MRCWVLVDSAFNVHLYRHGVLRTSAVAYDASDLGNRHAHLTNHCIAATHTDYGKFEPTTEMWYEEFDAELGRRFAELAAAHDGSVLKGVVLPQIKRHVVQTLLASRERLEASGDYYRPFQLFGYDFLVDDTLRVWLCEVNASPAVADHLLPGLVSSRLRVAVDPFFPPLAELVGGGVDAYEAAAAAREAKGEGFERIFASGREP